MPALLAMLESSVAALRAKALVSFALLAQTHLPLLLLAFQAKLSPQVTSLCLTWKPPLPPPPPTRRHPGLVLLRLLSKILLACALTHR